MPPKAKFTRQEIVEAAVDIARRAPLEAVTAQELASVLGTSTRPVFTYFRTLEEVRAAVVEEAGKIYGRYVERGLSMDPPFKGYGMETIRFAREERTSSGCSFCAGETPPSSRRRKTTAPISAAPSGRPFRSPTRRPTSCIGISGSMFTGSAR